MTTVKPVRKRSLIVMNPGVSVQYTAFCHSPSLVCFTSLTVLFATVLAKTLFAKHKGTKYCSHDLEETRKRLLNFNSSHNSVNKHWAVSCPCVSLVTVSGSSQRQIWMNCPKGALVLQLTASTSAGEGPRTSRIYSRPEAPAGQFSGIILWHR